MRLLYFDDAGELAWKDFTGKPIPPYAILSHRWGDDEIVFDDLISGDYSSRNKNFEKIYFCSRQAWRENLKYFWIDSCCINRWNHQERSDAINSMFTWYKNAQRCYVFLPDVSTSSAADVIPQSEWETSFRSSKWFTRGWTLQELIAPPTVEFFSLEGHRLGDKGTLEQLIHEITKIPVSALQGHPLDHFSVSERMGWAAKRETTEEEDAVYCLLGILNVEMPFVYNEGKEKAMARLDESLTVADTSTILPFSRNDRFTGRDQEIEEIETCLRSDDHMAKIFILGEGGIGKSQLALEIAFRVKEHQRDCSVFWIDASDPDSLRQAYASIAKKLRIPGWNEEMTDARQLVANYLSKEYTGQWLLIFDGVDNHGQRQSTSSVESAIEDLKRHFPDSKSGSIIFTTTRTDLAMLLSSSHITRLQALPINTAEKLFRSQLNQELLLNDAAEMTVLLDELSCLPLVIVHATAYINLAGVTLRRYREQLLEYRSEAMELNSESSGSINDGLRASNPITMTILISLAHVTSKSLQGHGAYPADEALFLAACVDRRDIPLVLLQATDRNKVLQVLGSLALITRRPADSSYEVKQSIQMILQRWLRKHGMLNKWIHEATRRLLAAFPTEHHENRSSWRRFLPHARHALAERPVGDEDRDWLELTWQCALTLHEDGRYMEAAELGVRVVESCRRLLGPDDPDTLMEMSNLALVYRNLGRWKEAEDLQLRVSETRERVLGAEHPDTLISSSILATIYTEKGQYKGAEQLLRRVIHVRKIALGEEHPDTLSAISKLAQVYKNDGARISEVEELEVRVLEIRKRVLGEDHPSTLSVMANLVSTYGLQGRWSDSEQLAKQELQGSVKVLGKEHPSVLTRLANLAMVYNKQGRLRDAEELLESVVDTRRKAIGEEHPETLTSMADLAIVCSEQGQWEKAERLQIRVLEIRKRLLGDDHPDTLIAMSELAYTWRFLGHDAKALLLDDQK